MNLKISLLLVAFSVVLATKAQVGIGTTAPNAQLHTTGSVKHEILKGATTRLLYADSSGKLLTTVGGRTIDNNTAVAIPDNGCATGNGAYSIISISGMPTAVSGTNISVRINITHPDVAQLAIFLVAPNGIMLNLASGNGGGGNFFNTVFFDSAATNISTGSAPFDDQYKPLGLTATTCTFTPSIATFASFGNIVPDGVWALRILDNTSGGVGTLNNWSMSFSGPITAFGLADERHLARFTAGGLSRSNIYQAANGYFGINTTTPQAPMHLVNYLSPMFFTPTLILDDHGGYYPSIRFKGAPYFSTHSWLITGLLASGDHQLQFSSSSYTGGLAMFLKDDGSLGINTFSFSVPSTYTNNKPQAFINTSRDVGLWVRSSSSDVNGLLLLEKTGVGGVVDEFVWFKTNGGYTTGTISYNPANNGISFNSTSDARLKTRIRPTALGLPALMQIQVSDYAYKADSASSTVTGFIAQQLYDIYPQAVTKGGDDEKSHPWMVDYGKLTPLLVKAIQDQQAQIEALRTELTVLKAAVEKAR